MDIFMFLLRVVLGVGCVIAVVLFVTYGVGGLIGWGQTLLAPNAGESSKHAGYLLSALLALSVAILLSCLFVATLPPVEGP